MSPSLPVRSFVLLSHRHSSTRIQPFRRSLVGLATFSPPRSILWRSFTSGLPGSKNTNRVKDNLSGGITPPGKLTVRENIYTIPNFLTLSRILACPVLGWSIFHDDFYLATSLLVYAGLSDIVDGYLARRFDMRSVLGTILDPAADKALMTTLTVALTMKGLLPASLAVIIIGRDALLSLSAFYIRYTSLPAPKTFARYWDFSIPSAEVRPTTISKFNTAAQLALMFMTTVAPIGPGYLSTYLPEMQLLVAATTVWSGLSYVFSKDAVRVISETRKRRQLPP
ncbi:CDP-alcohol phosphatidyltransferase-domain-containing protein [Scleroderma citrinum]